MWVKTQLLCKLLVFSALFSSFVILLFFSFFIFFLLFFPLFIHFIFLTVVFLRLIHTYIEFTVGLIMLSGLSQGLKSFVCNTWQAPCTVVSSHNRLRESFTTEVVTMTSALPVVLVTKCAPVSILKEWCKFTFVHVFLSRICAMVTNPDVDVVVVQPEITGDTWRRRQTCPCPAQA